MLVEKTRQRHQDLSDNFSELDSGIRSFQGNDEGDTTPNNCIVGQMKVEKKVFGPSTGTLSYGNRDCIQLAPLEKLCTTKSIQKIGKFEISKSISTSSGQIGLSINNNLGEKKFIGLPLKGQTTLESPCKKEFLLTGDGSLFLKSNNVRNDIRDKHQSNEKSTLIDVEPRQREAFATSPGVRSILRDSSLTDIRNRPSVRFNLSTDDVKSSSSNCENSLPENIDDDDEEEEEVSSKVVNSLSPVTQLAILKSRNHASETIKKKTLKSFTVLNDDKPSIFSLFDKTDEGGKNVSATATLLPKVTSMYSDDTSDSESKEAESGNLEFDLKDHSKFQKKVDKGKQQYKEVLEEKIMLLKKDNESSLARELRAEELRFKVLLKAKEKEIEEKHLADVLDTKREAEAKLTEIKMGIKLQNEEDLEQFKTKLEEEFKERRKQINDEYRHASELLQKNHNEMLEELERDLKLELEIIRKEHQQKLSETQASVEHDIEVERQRMRECGEDRLYEKVRCEKRLLEDKYRCLKEKYMKLKHDIKISMERKKGRREQQNIATTASEASNNKSDENQSGVCGKPPLGVINGANHQLKLSTGDDKPTISNKNLKFVQNDETSISQSDTTISNQYIRCSRYRVPNNQTENGNSDSEAFDVQISKTKDSRINQNNNTIFDSAGTVVLSTADEHNVRQKRRLIARSKSASTSRLPSVESIERPCTPVESLRNQLKHLEELEEQIPETTLDSPYRLRYPFSDISNQGTGSSELDFFKHRIHLEKDSVRRAKESLRAQRESFRAKQKEIKQRHTSKARHTMDQLILVSVMFLFLFYSES